MRCWDLLWTHKSLQKFRPSQKPEYADSQRRSKLTRTEAWDQTSLPHDEALQFPIKTSVKKVFQGIVIWAGAAMAAPVKKLTSVCWESSYEIRYKEKEL